MYNMEKSKSKLKSKSKHNPNYPSYNSSSLLDKLNKSLKTHPSKSHQYEDINNFTYTKTKTPKYATNSLNGDEKMRNLRRLCLVEKEVSGKVISRGERTPNSRSSSTLLEEFDFQATLLSRTITNSTTITTTQYDHIEVETDKDKMYAVLPLSSSTSNTTSSLSSDETDYSVFSHPKQKTLVTCFAPKRPKPIKTHSNESKFLEKNDNFIKSRSMAAKVYSNLKNLKQPISPGARLTTFINSLLTKDRKTSTNKNSIKVTKHRKTNETTSTTSSTCSSASSFSRSCLMNKSSNKFQDDGIKRTVRFSPVSVIVDDDSQPCEYKSLHGESENLLMNTKFKRSLSERYQELKRLNGLVKDNDMVVQQNQKKLEEVALGLLSGYWDARLNKSLDLSSEIKGHNDGDYGDNHGLNCGQHEYEDVNDDGFSCSSSDLFELDHLSLIGNELPVYETTHFDNKIM